MRVDPSGSVTQCENVEIAASLSSQHPEITGRSKKVHRADHFCLTDLGAGGYFAGPPPSGCGGKEAASATHCGTNVDSGGFRLGMAGGIYPGGEVRLVGGMLWH